MNAPSLSDTDANVNRLNFKMELRPYQSEGKYRIYEHWAAGKQNVLAIYPTGAGKTVLYSDIVAEYAGASCVVAHRQELVGQTCVALARNGVRHGIIAPDSVVKNIIALEIAEIGRSYFDTNSRVKVAGVDTALSRIKEGNPWAQQVGLFIQDEAHHMLRENKWGKVVSLFPHARVLGVTACSSRADGKGLGREADGIFDEIVIGPTMRELIKLGYLSEYRIFAPPSDIDLSGVEITASGDFSPDPLRKAVHKASRLVGDIVEHYQRIAPGKLGVTFAVDIESAKEIAQAYRAAGVPAEVITGTTPTLLRANLLRRFARREILQLVNVDIFGEGFDLPALEVVSFARPTASYQLFKQQFGRVLRIMASKTHGIVIDHVDNVRRHGLPDMPRLETLSRRQRRASNTPNDAIPLTTCLNPPCLASVYPRYLKCCPYCGFANPIAGRSLPEMVDGDLHEISPEWLAQMRGEIEKMDTTPATYGGVIGASILKNHRERLRAQAELRRIMMEWGGTPERLGNEPVAQREFYLRFGIDVWTAMTLPASEADALAEKIRRSTPWR
jgi:DNA repair protein RadD